MQESTEKDSDKRLVTLFATEGIPSLKTRSFISNPFHPHLLRLALGQKPGGKRLLDAVHQIV